MKDGAALDSKSILSEVVAGRRMTDEEFAFLSEHGDLDAIGEAACTARDKIFQDDLITFIIDRRINYTNICSCKCKFCTFFRDKTDRDAYVIDKATLFGQVMEAMEFGAIQLILQGGLNEELKIDFFENMFKDIKGRYGLTIHSLTPPEVVFIAQNSGLTITDTLLRLKKAGLDSLPGGGADILHDEVRKQISPHKINTATWLEVMRTAHRLGIKSTATMMMGTVESSEHRLAHLREIRNLQDETHGFRAFIVWNYRPGDSGLRGAELSSSDYLRFLALSRLYLDNIDHIQGSWFSPEETMRQEMIAFGADDLGSLILNDNMVSVPRANYMMQLENMLELIRQAGRTPALRDTAYEVLRVFD